MFHKLSLWALTSFVVMSQTYGMQANASPWTIDDLLQAESVTALTVSPDGESAAWVRETVTKVEGEEKRIANLWLSDLEEGTSFQLTYGVDGLSEPAFSPDGKAVAFLSDRKIPQQSEKAELGKVQIWVVALRGGEARPITRFDRSVAAFGWQDPQTLIVAAPESPSAWEAERKKSKDTTIIVDDAENTPPIRLFRVPLEGSPRRLTRNRDWIRDLVVAPDGGRAVVVAQQDLKYNFDQKNPPEVLVVDLSTGASTPLGQPEALLPGDLRWAPDGSGIYFVNEHTRHPTYRMATISELYFHSLGSDRKTEKVELEWPQGLGRGYLPTEGGVIALLEEGVFNRAVLLTKSERGWSRKDLEGTHTRHIDRWAASRDGNRLVYLHSTASTPPQLFSGTMAGTSVEDATQLANLNKSFEDKATGRVDVLRWIGAEGDEVEGLLHYPLDWKQGDGPRPLVVRIHGGPAAADRHSWSQRWSAPPILFRQRGAFVLQTNYHGSSGYGLDWVESIEQRYYELEPVDILAGVDHLIAEGLVDPDQLGCTGWSNGGILTADLITRTDRFKAASVGAADVEWISDWANVDFGAAFDNYYFGGTPWEKREDYLRKSPFFKLPEVTTPTIVYTGTEDRNVPPHQSWSLFRALQYHEKADVRLVVFPGEFHSLRKIPHQRRKLEEEFAWFDRYLFSTAKEKEDFLKKESPLAALLARNTAARVDSSLGEEWKGLLIPEVTTSSILPGLAIGRFEVTRAQFQAFASDFTVSPGDENLPATTLTFRQAQDYVAWLSELTGRPFRLPKQEELDKLVEAAGHKGNTLDRWAGYTPNPEDEEMLREAVRGLPGPAPLLMVGGSLPGLGKPEIFDLDGNAAEWAVTPEGDGVVLGPSADRSSDRRTATAADDPAYIGLRVVVDEPTGSE